MHDHEAHVLRQLAQRETADVVDFYEVGGEHPRYTVRKHLGTSAAADLAERLDPKARQAFLAALAQLGDAVDVQAFGSAFARGDMQGMIDAVDYGDIDVQLGDAVDVVLLGYAQSGAATARELGGLLGGKLRMAFDVTNPAAATWAANYGSTLIRQITDETKAVVREAIKRAIGADISRRDAILTIRSVVGLTDRQAGAVERMRADLLVTGASQRSIEQRTAAYADRLLRDRATLIARTEIQDAVHAGQREAWTQAAGKELLDTKTTRRMWIVTDDDRLCEDCEPLDAQEVAFDDEFDDGDPPLHPGCRCTVGLVFDDSEGSGSDD